MHTDLKKWEKARTERDAAVLRADADRLEREMAERVEQAAELARKREAAAVRDRLAAELRASVHSLIDAAAALRSSGVHLYDVARIAGSAARRYHTDTANHPLGDQATDFTLWLGHFASTGA